MSLSQEDTLRIVRHFLLSSPPGEFEDVLSDIRELVQNDELLNKGAFEIFHTYNIEQLIPVDVVGKEHKVILSKYNEISESQYLDPISNSVITVDHTKGQVTKVEPAESENEDVSKKRALLQTAIDKYVADHYLSGLGTVYPVQGNASEYIVCITASKFNEKNFWSGRWRSVYRISLEGETKAKVSGSMKVNVHYYESGNVQLNTSKEHGESISTGSFEEIATKSADVIRKAETNFHGDIDEQCTNLNETFKTLRRRLPISKRPFDFTAAFQHKMAKEMTGK